MTNQVWHIDTHVLERIRPERCRDGIVEEGIKCTRDERTEETQSAVVRRDEA